MTEEVLRKEYKYIKNKNQQVFIICCIYMYRKRLYIKSLHQKCVQGTQSNAVYIHIRTYIYMT